MSQINRRQFLKLAGLVGVASAGAVALPGFSKLLDGRHVPDLEQLSAQRAAIDYRQAKIVPTICFGCTNHCGVIGYVQDGKVRKIEGNPLDPNSRGTICAKANGMLSYTYYPERLLYPLKRVGARGAGQWKRVSWDEALAEVAGKLKATRDSGHPERFVFHYGRDKTQGVTSRFTDAYGTPNRLNRRAICSNNKRVPAMSFYGREFEWETQDFENSRYILNFGNNCFEAYQGGISMMPRIQKARVEHGCKMVTFEVRPSATASKSDEYWPVFPGSDGAIAYAMCNAIIDAGKVNTAFFERWANIDLTALKNHIAAWTPEWAEEQSGVPAAEIRRIALEFAAAAPHCTTMPARGSAKHYNGVGNDRGIKLLDVLVGNVGMEGGLCLSNGRGWKKGRYGLWDLPSIGIPGPKPEKLSPFVPGSAAYEDLPEAVQARVERLDSSFSKRYFGELATPSEYPLSWHWYNMRVGQLVHPYIKEGRAKVEVYMSYALGAAYGFPEAGVCREVLLDEALIPYHVAIDINFSEQAALADLILPDATSLERWDAHGTNSYSLVPYTGIRQPLVEPLGEARPVQEILKALAQRIGGGMEQYFAWERLEDFYREWYKNIAAEFGGGEAGWQEFLRRGIWQDQNRAKDYRLYERPVPAEELAGSRIDEHSGVIFDAKDEAIGIMMPDAAGTLQAVRGFPTPSRRIQVQDPIFPLAARSVGLDADDPNGALLPTWFPIPGFERIVADDQLVLSTFKWNVHTQGRSAYWKYSAEIAHTNDLFINPQTARRFGLTDGDTVEVTVHRPEGNTYRANETAPVGVFRNRVKLLEGVHPRALCFAHGAGHWEHGAVARAEQQASLPEAAKGLLADTDIAENLWWSKAKGGPGNGVQGMNDYLPINPSVLVGGQNWFDNRVSLKKVSA